MDLATAGEYLALAPGSLLSLLRREHVSPVDLGLKLRRWRRRDLDELVQRLPMSWVQRTEGEREAKVTAEAALAAVERRAQASRASMTQRRHREVRSSHPAA